MKSDRNRALVLEQVRAALGVKGINERRQQTVAERLRRHPRGTIPARAGGNPEALLQRFATMLMSQGAEVVHAATPGRAVAAIADALRARDLPAALRVGTDPSLAALPWDTAPAISLRFGKAESGDAAALSRAVAGAAETGTLFLVSGADNPTTLAFLPELHVVLIHAEDIVGAYEDAFDRLRKTFGGKLPRSVNMISGPSRTADIEQTIVRGAHGPKHLLVVILG